MYIHFSTIYGNVLSDAVDEKSNYYDVVIIVFFDFFDHIVTE